MSNTIAGYFLRQATARANETAIYSKVYGRYRSLTWHEWLLDVQQAAGRLLSLGVQPQDRVVLFSENRYEWSLVDLALHWLGAVHVPVHATLSGAQVGAQVVDSEARLLIVSRSEMLDQVDSANVARPAGTAGIDQLPCVVLGDADQRPPGIPMAQPELRPGAIAWDTIDGTPFLARVKELENAVESRLASDDLATILYTSGTTGEPKGVMLSQRNLVSNATAVARQLGSRSSDMRLGFLPLSHIFARTCDLYVTVVSGGSLAMAESRETTLDDCQKVRPTIINGVPYFYDKVRSKLRQLGVADRPESLRQILGGRIRLCNVGGAPLPGDLYDFFAERHLPLLEGYGLTESSPVIACSNLSAHRRGAVGPVLEGVDVRIAEDGEILVRGPNVLIGYWHHPEATAAVLAGGWLHTGDLGRLDDERFLYITGRKKDLIVTATGKNIAPARLEALLVSHPLIAQAVVVGDRQKYLGALIVPDANGLLDSPASPNVSPNGSLEYVLREAIDQQLADESKHEQIAKFTILPRALSVELGELTPKMSLRRDVIRKNFATEYERLFTETDVEESSAEQT